MSSGDKLKLPVYDYIICGYSNYSHFLVKTDVRRGGTAGCTVAARLAADPNIHVLILEAGEDNAGFENTQMPGWWDSYSSLVSSRH
jgi:hypothetical protein